MTAPDSDPNRATARRSASWRKDIGPVSNAVLYLAFCLLAASGLALTFRLEDGSATLLGVEKRDWATVHTIAGLSVLTLVALHVWVNWPWIRATLARLRWRTVLVTVLGMAMLALALLAPVR